MHNDKLSGDIIIRGQVKEQNIDRVLFWAAAPPTYGTSYYGSGLPYPDALVSYDRTPNRGSVNVVNGKFEFRINWLNLSIFWWY